jgi:hypothetical protein
MTCLEYSRLWRARGSSASVVAVLRGVVLAVEEEEEEALGIPIKSFNRPLMSSALKSI